MSSETEEDLIGQVEFAINGVIQQLAEYVMITKNTNYNLPIFSNLAMLRGIFNKKGLLENVNGIRLQYELEIIDLLEYNDYDD